MRAGASLVVFHPNRAGRNRVECPILELFRTGDFLVGDPTFSGHQVLRGRSLARNLNVTDVVRAQDRAPLSVMRVPTPLRTVCSRARRSTRVGPRGIWRTARGAGSCRDCGIGNLGLRNHRPDHVRRVCDQFGLRRLSFATAHHRENECRLHESSHRGSLAVISDRGARRVAGPCSRVRKPQFFRPTAR